MFKQKIFLILATAITNVVLSQNNTSSPYSLFGIGSENKTTTGSLAGLGNTGIANDSPLQINLTNPASLGNIVKKSFLYEFGVNYTSSEIKNSLTSENAKNGNISHVAIAFPIKHNWGLSIGLLPQTKVGYDITIDSNVLGTEEELSINTNGEGGINNFYIATGIKLNKKLNLGLEASFLFGTISETQRYTSNSTFLISEDNNYLGFNLKTGFQYAFFNKKNQKTTIGGTLQIPVTFSGSQIRSSSAETDAGTIIIVENEVENDIQDIDLPIASGLGITSNIYKDFTASLDYKKLLWANTDQAIETEQYSNQDIYAFGLEYAPSKRKLKYLNRLKYRFGFNYNSGFLTISDKKINSYFVSLGAGIPLGKTSRNLMNLSYSYGREGTTQNDLIQENFHKITLNLSFIGKWFQERKIF